VENLTEGPLQEANESYQHPPVLPKFLEEAGDIVGSLWPLGMNRFVHMIPFDA